MIYAVIDTNVIVSSLLSRKIDTGTVPIRKHILDGTIVPVFNEEIFQEYETCFIAQSSICRLMQ